MTMNVYVSPELRERMRECGNTINWSRVAVIAFEAAIEGYWKGVLFRKQTQHIRKLASEWIQAGGMQW